MFRKKLKPEEKKELCKQIHNGITGMKKALKFIQDYGAYKTRTVYKLSDVEYLKRLKATENDIQTMYIQFVVAINILKKNKIFDYYNIELSEIIKIILGDVLKNKKEVKG